MRKIVVAAIGASVVASGAVAQSQVMYDLYCNYAGHGSTRAGWWIAVQNSSYYDMFACERAGIAHIANHAGQRNPNGESVRFQCSSVRR